MRLLSRIVDPHRIDLLVDTGSFAIADNTWAIFDRHAKELSHMVELDEGGALVVKSSQLVSDMVLWYQFCTHRRKGKKKKEETLLCCC
eukprot:m.258199 g.258199  ORF g.258199 m.258199 type:complete len:88 (+) comp36261_c0_seq1:714-977(+)